LRWLRNEDSAHCNAPSILIGAVVAANRAVVLLLVNKPIFCTLPAKNVVAGASDLPNLH
jgi:hypothetical protein